MANQISTGDTNRYFWEQFNLLVGEALTGVGLVGTTLRFQFRNGSVIDVPNVTSSGGGTSSGIQTASNGLSKSGNDVRLGGTVNVSAQVHLTGTNANVSFYGEAVSGSTEFGFGATNSATNPVINMSMTDIDAEVGASMQVSQASPTESPLAKMVAADTTGAPGAPYAKVQTQVTGGVGRVDVEGSMYVNGTRFEPGYLTQVRSLNGVQTSITCVPGELILLSSGTSYTCTVSSPEIGAILYVLHVGGGPNITLQFQGDLGNFVVDNSTNIKLTAVYTGVTRGWVRL